MKLYLIGCASGGGKTSIMTYLKYFFGEKTIAVYNFDDIEGKEQC